MISAIRTALAITAESKHKYENRLSVYLMELCARKGDKPDGKDTHDDEARSQHVKHDRGLLDCKLSSKALLLAFGNLQLEFLTSAWFNLNDHGVFSPHYMLRNFPLCPMTHRFLLGILLAFTLVLSGRQEGMREGREEGGRKREKRKRRGVGGRGRGREIIQMQINTAYSTTSLLILLSYTRAHFGLHWNEPNYTEQYTFSHWNAVAFIDRWLKRCFAADFEHNLQKICTFFNKHRAVELKTARPAAPAVMFILMYSF